MKLLNRIKKFLKQSKCQHAISDNHECGGSSGPNVRDNYTVYSCMLCGKIIKYIGKSIVMQSNKPMTMSKK